MATAGGSLAEIYVLKKLNKEKMKRMESEGERKEEKEHKEKRPTSGNSNKIHSCSFPVSDSAGKPPQLEKLSD